MNEQMIQALAEQVSAAIARSEARQSEAMRSAIADMQAAVDGKLDALERSLRVEIAEKVSASDLASVNDTAKSVAADLEAKIASDLTAIREEISGAVDAQFKAASDLTAGMIEDAIEKAGEGCQTSVVDVDAKLTKAIETAVGALSDVEKDVLARVDAVEAKALEAVEKQIAAIPAPEPALPGKDAAELDILPSIAPEKSYPHGTYAQHKGGIWRAIRETDPLGDCAAKAGWAVVVRGVEGIEVHELADGEIAVKTVLTGGQDHITKINMGGLYYKGVWQDQEYEKNAAVTWGGSLWVAEEKTTDTPGAGHGWRLAVKRGRDAKAVKA